MTEQVWPLGAAPSGVLPPEALLGRDADVTRLRERCATSRLVTLLGPGGSGKTALAAAVAPAVAATIGVRPVWIDLQPVDDPDRVVATLAAALAVNPDPAAKDASAALAAEVGGREVLLVLDNCEQVVGAVADVLDVLVPACPGVRVLTTSREVVGVSGEEVVRLEPLAVPPDGVPADAALLHDHPATALFLTRAGLRADELDADARRAVAAVCRALDGLPLAIELAAARSPALSPQAIEAALADRFRLLSTRRRTAAQRQRTLEASIAWSHDLLDEDEQHLLRSLAVFPSRFDLQQAAVVGANGDEHLALDLLTGLIDKSLVTAQDRPSGRRYRLLESVRSFGEHRLLAADELDAARARHLDATRDRLRRLGADEAHEGLVLRAEEWVVEELDDVRAAAELALETGRPDLAVDLWWAVHFALVLQWRFRDVHPEVVRIDRDSLDDVRCIRLDVATALGPGMAFVLGDLGAGDRALAALSARDEDDLPLTTFCALLWTVLTLTWRTDHDPELVGRRAAQAQALEIAHRQRWGRLPQVAASLGAGRMAGHALSPADAYDRLGEAIRLAETEGARMGAALLQAQASVLAPILGLPSTTQERHLDEFETLVADLPSSAVAWVTVGAGWVVATSTGDVELLRARVARYGRLAGRHGTVTGDLLALAAADLARLDGDTSRAVEEGRRHVDRPPGGFLRRIATAVLLNGLVDAGRLEEASALAQRLPPPAPNANLLIQGQYAGIAAARAELATGRPAAALARVHDLVEQTTAMGVVIVLAGLVAAAAAAMAALGRHEDAARTLGVLAGETRARGHRLWPDFRELADRAEAAVRDALGDDGFDVAFVAGHEVTFDEWATWLGGRGTRDADRDVAGWGALTETEVDVALRVAEGLSNAEVADAMFISINTVKTHLRHVYAKLDVTNRAALAALVAATSP